MGWASALLRRVSARMLHYFSFFQGCCFIIFSRRTAKTVILYQREVVSQVSVSSQTLARCLLYNWSFLVLFNPPFGVKVWQAKVILPLYSVRLVQNWLVTHHTVNQMGIINGLWAKILWAHCIAPQLKLLQFVRFVNMPCLKVPMIHSKWWKFVSLWVKHKRNSMQHFKKYDQKWF